MPGQRHTFRTRRLRRCFDLRIAGGDRQHLRHHRLVPVNDDVDRVLPENAQTDLAADRLGRAEQDVADDRGDARSAPAVGEGGPQRVGQHAAVVVVDAHGGAVHALHHRAIDARGFHALPAPHALPLGRSQSEGGQPVLLAGELLDHELCQVAGDLLPVAPGLFDSVAAGGAPKRALVADLVAAAFALGDLREQKGQVAPVIGVGGRATGHLAQVVAGDHRIGVRSADPVRRFRPDPAGSHVTDAAAQAVLAKGTLVGLGVHAGEAGVDAFGLGLLQHFERSRVHHPLFRLLQLRASSPCARPPIDVPPRHEPAPTSRR